MQPNIDRRKSETCTKCRKRALGTVPPHQPLDFRLEQTSEEDYPVGSWPENGNCGCLAAAADATNLAAASKLPQDLGIAAPGSRQPPAESIAGIRVTSRCSGGNASRVSDAAEWAVPCGRSYRGRITALPSNHLTRAIRAFLGSLECVAVVHFPAEDVRRNACSHASTSTTCSGILLWPVSSASSSFFGPGITLYAEYMEVGGHVSSLKPQE